MKLFLIFVAATLLTFGLLFVWTSVQVLRLEAQYPPEGQFIGRDGQKTHFVDLLAGKETTLPPIMFVHGASGNLNDQMAAFAPTLKGKARLLFVDRPGHGYSDRGGAETPAQQAARFKALLDELSIDKVVLVGHSLGASSVAAFAVLYPQRVKGLVFMAPATHPWTTGVTWYYDIAALPIIGTLFTETLSLPVGERALEAGARHVFEPQPLPSSYIDSAAIALVLRPKNFRNNARDVSGLSAFVKEFAPRYKEIDVPTVVITGDVDDVVAPSIHSIGLERDIKGAELIILPGVGHKPDYVATDIAIKAIYKVAR